MVTTASVVVAVAVVVVVGAAVVDVVVGIVVSGAVTIIVVGGCVEFVTGGVGGGGGVVSAALGISSDRQSRASSQLTSSPSACAQPCGEPRIQYTHTVRQNAQLDFSSTLSNISSTGFK